MNNIYNRQYSGNNGGGGSYGGGYGNSVGYDSNFFKGGPGGGMQKHWERPQQSSYWATSGDGVKSPYGWNQGSKGNSGWWGHNLPGGNTPNAMQEDPRESAGRWAKHLNRGNFDKVWNKARHVDDPSQHMTEGITAGYSDFDKWKTHMQDVGWTGQGPGGAMGGGAPGWVPRGLQGIHQYFANPDAGAAMGLQNPINSAAGRQYAELAKEHNQDQWEARNRRAGMMQARHFPNPLMGRSWS